MSSRAGHQIQTTGFYVSGFLSLGLAVRKLTAIVNWSWWRVMLPLGVFLGHNAAYILVGFICLFCARYGEEEEEEEQSIDETNLLQGYRFAAMLFFLIFLDNLLRWIEGRGDSNWFWLCSGKLGILVLFGVLSLVAHFLYWSGMVATVNEQRPGG
jgi:H+/Cl- antiporter ClcA